MTTTLQPARRRRLIRSIAVVWPLKTDGWRSYRTLRLQLEQTGISVHLVARDQLLDIEHGLCDIDAIATIDAPLDAARRVAARRDIPYLALDFHLRDPSIDLIETEPTSTPVLDVTIDDHLPLIALRSVVISTPGVAGDDMDLFAASTDAAGSCRHRCRQPGVMFVDRRAIRLPQDALVTVRHGSSYLREHRR